MNLPTQTFKAVLIFCAFGWQSTAEEPDSSADPARGGGEESSPQKFETTGEFEVSPVPGWNPESIDSEEWPKIDNPTDFNRHFNRPFKIWRVDGGYFGAFNGGEWGGALFFAAHDATKWTRIIDTHIQDVERFEGDSFLVTGGLPHLSFSGAAYLVTRTPQGQWSARLVFKSNTGIPRIVGTSMTDSFQKAESKKLIVLALEYAPEQSPLFGVDPTGAIHYLGEQTGNTQPFEIVPYPAGTGPADPFAPEANEPSKEE